MNLLLKSCFIVGGATSIFCYRNGYPLSYTLIISSVGFLYPITIPIIIIYKIKN